MNIYFAKATHLIRATEAPFGKTFQGHVWTSGQAPGPLPQRLLSRPHPASGAISGSHGPEPQEDAWEQRGAALPDAQPTCPRQLPRRHRLSPRSRRQRSLPWKPLGKHALGLLLGRMALECSRAQHQHRSWGGGHRDGAGQAALAAEPPLSICAEPPGDLQPPPDTFPWERAPSPTNRMRR